MPTSPRTPAAHHYIEAEQGLATLSALGADEAERIVECLVALVHAVLAIAAGMTRRTPPDDDTIAFGRDY